MKILQVISTPPNALATGGLARSVPELSRQLVKMGHSVTIATTDVLDSRNRCVTKHNPENLDGITVYRFKNISNLLAWKYKLYLSPSLLLYLRKNVKSFDVVHLQDILSSHAIATARYCTQYGVPYVLTTHGSALWFSQKKTINHMIYALLGRRILEDSTLLTAVTESELAQQKNLGVPESKIVIIPNGLDVSRFDTLPRQGNFRSKYNLGSERIVLFLGRIHKRKGIDFLVRAFGLVAKERTDCILVIAGPDDGYRKNIENLAEAIGVADRVKFTSFVDNEREAYVDADMLVYPAIDEIFGLVPFEATMCGTPVVVTDDCGCGELVKKANCGLLVKYGDIHDLKNKISTLLDSDEKRNLSRQGRKYIMNNLSWEEVARRYEAAYIRSVRKSEI
jgi:glycosyltransferase involved in cell wall biosynthesis